MNELERQVTEKLAPIFERFPREAVERVVVETYEPLAEHAKITAFLPVLTERSAKERLRAIERGAA